jgi:MFS family permease
MSGAIILMVSVVPLAKRPAYQGFFGAVFGISSVAGPLLGGAFTTNVSWRWCFYINLPIGAVSILAIMFLLKPTPPVHPGLSVKEQLSRLDLLGQFFLLPSIICLLLALQWGGSTYEWSNWRIIFLFTLFGVTFMAFGASQIFRQEVATISIRIVKNRSILAAMWFTLCLSGTMLTLVFYLSIWFQAIKVNFSHASYMQNYTNALDRVHRLCSLVSTASLWSSLSSWLASSPESLLARSATTRP